MVIGAFIGYIADTEAEADHSAPEVQKDKNTTLSGTERKLSSVQPNLDGIA